MGCDMLVVILQIKQGGCVVLYTNQSIMASQSSSSPLGARLRDKSIALIGFQTLTGRVLLKRLLPLTRAPLLAVHFGKQPPRNPQFANDPYFTQPEQQQLRTQLRHVPLAQLPEHLDREMGGRLDLLFSTFELGDFSSEDKVADHHLVRTSQVRAALARVKVGKCLLLSSIYLREPGYVGEDDELEETASIQPQFSSRQEALAYLKDNFSSPLEAWKWSISYVQKCYFAFSSTLVVVRVPALGPTLGNYEGAYSHSPRNLGYLVCEVGLGKIRSVDGVRSNKIDVVPTDYASNLLLVLAARETAARVETVNLSTSTRHYITLQQFVDMSRQAWQDYGEKPAHISIVQTVLGQKIKHQAEKLPSEVKKRLGAVLGVVSWKIEGQRQSQEEQQRQATLSKYRYFLCNEWLCESIKTIDLFNSLSPSEQVLYDFNVNHIPWKVYVKLCVFAMRKHVLHQQVEQFQPESMDLLGLRTESYFSDITWALRQGRDVPGQTRREAVQFVLHSRAVKEAIRGAAEEEMVRLESKSGSYEQAEEEVRRVAEEICVTMFSDYSMGSIRVFAWFLHKIFTTIYEKVVVDKSAIQRIQAHSESRGPLVIIPTHRSYVDFLIVSYIFFGNGIRCPHIAAAEDFLGMAVVHILLRRSGAFFIKRNQKKHRQLYKAILNEYLSKLMVGNHYLEFFIEGTRSRTGKMLPPKYGMLGTIAQNVAEGRLPDAFILPVTINYEKVLEGHSFTYEMMGEAKVKESLSRVLKSADVIKENYGRIHLEFCELISVKQWLAGSEGIFAKKMEALGARVVHTLSQNLVVSGPSIVASVVLMNRKGVSDDSLQEQTTWLSKELAGRGVKITRSQSDSSVSVGSTLPLLEGVVSKSKKDMFEVEVSFDQNSFVKLFTLTYYRNTLTHIFFEEAIIATALASFGFKAAEAGVDKEALHQRALWLWQLLDGQFYLQHTLHDRTRFEHLLGLMGERGLLRAEGILLKGLNLEGHCYSFYWSLVWPVVESYWLTCLYLFKLKKTSSPVPLPKLYTQVQWFGQSLVNDRICSYLEAISADTVKNAVAAFTRMGGLKAVRQEREGQLVSTVRVEWSEEELKAVLERVELYLRSAYGRSLRGVLGSRHGSASLDFPFLSRL